jgi:hypothetical protein
MPAASAMVTRLRVGVPPRVSDPFAGPASGDDPAVGGLAVASEPGAGVVAPENAVVVGPRRGDTRAQTTAPAMRTARSAMPSLNEGDDRDVFMGGPYWARQPLMFTVTGAPRTGVEAELRYSAPERVLRGRGERS